MSTKKHTLKFSHRCEKYEAVLNTGNVLRIAAARKINSVRFEMYRLRSIKNSATKFKNMFCQFSGKNSDRQRKRERERERERDGEGGGEV